MDRLLRTWLDTHDGLVTSAEAARLGMAPSGLSQLARTGALHRLARGVFADPARLGPGVSATDRHLVTVRGLLRHRSDLAASHVSAAAVWGLPLMTAHLDRVHVVRTRAGGTTRRLPSHTVHTAYPEDAITRVADLSVVCVALAVIGVSVLRGVEAGVMAADAALWAGHLTLAELTDWRARLLRTPGMAAVRSVTALADARSESPGESRLRLILLALGYAVTPQFTVQDRGRFVARVDFLIPALGVVVEFDGAVKYDGAEGRSALVAEKNREDAIRRCGYGVVRITWADLTHPHRIRELITAAALTATVSG